MVWGVIRLSPWVVTKSAPVPPVLDEFLVLQAVKNPSEIRTAKYTNARNLIRIFLPEKENRLLYPFVYQEYVGSANLEPSSWSVGYGCKVALDNNRAAACRAASRLETWGLPCCGAHAVFAVVRIAQTSQAQYYSDCFRHSATMLQRRIDDQPAISRKMIGD